MAIPRGSSGKTQSKRDGRARVPPGGGVVTSAAQESVGRSRPRRQIITDARAMRALAHPLRVALLEAMRRDGEITATRAAELLGESPGNMSWHLQTLAKYGFVEETGHGLGRSRPWRLTSETRSFQTGSATDPETATASEALERTFLERTYSQMREWWSRRLTYPAKWRSAAFMTDSVRYLTAAELAAIMDEVQVIFDRYADRTEKEKRPAGALPVRLHAHGHPLPETPSGN
jgi:DNA-binding transcriptional ArsR family regulator